MTTLGTIRGKFAARLHLISLIVLTLASGCSSDPSAGSATNCSLEDCGSTSVRDVGEGDEGLEQDGEVAGATDSDGDAVEGAADLETTETDVVQAECETGEQRCFSGLTAAECVDGAFEFTDCPLTHVCREGACELSSPVCDEGELVGCADATHLLGCNADRTGYEPIECPVETPNCLARLIECSASVCVPGELRCAPENTTGVEACSDDRSDWVEHDTCDHGTLCDSGHCLSPCEANEKDPSFLGCNYWAVDLDNLAQRCDLFEDGCSEPEVCDEETNVCEPSAASQSFSVSISNPHDQEVDVTITNGATLGETTVAVAGQTSTALVLDRLDVDGTGLSRNAFQITTNLPITAHQFNPAGNVDVFSNDASLLLPSNAGGLSYVVLGWATGPYGDGTQPISSDGSNQGAFGYVTVVNSSSERGTITVTPSVPIVGGGGVDAIAAGASAVIDMEPGDVLNLETAHEDGLDLTGTLIDSTVKVSVFAGHECAFVPDNPLNPYCDHIEQQLFPVETWGTRYFAAKLRPRGSEVDVWKIVAGVDETVIRTDPPLDGVHGALLSAGEALVFETDQSFHIEGSEPILVGQFMVGSNFPGIDPTCPANLGDCADGCGPRTECHEASGICVIPCRRQSDCRRGGLGRFQLTCAPDAGFCAIGGEGDPAFMLSVPANQYRDHYVFLTPAGFAHNFVTVIAPSDATFELDGAAISPTAPETIGTTGWQRFYIEMDAHATVGTPHTLSASSEFGVQVYGYDCDVSYAFPGGLNLNTE